MNIQELQNLIESLANLKNQKKELLKEKEELTQNINEKIHKKEQEIDKKEKEFYTKKSNYLNKYENLNYTVITKIKYNLKHYFVSSELKPELKFESWEKEKINYIPFIIIDNTLIRMGGGYIFALTSGDKVTDEEIKELNNGIAPKRLFDKNGDNFKL